MNNPIYFVAGRMNPPTPGHIKLIKAAIDESKKHNGIVKVYITQTKNKLESIKPIDGFDESCEIGKHVNVKNPKYQNPLSPDSKVKFINKMLGDDTTDNVEVINDLNCNGIFKARLCALKLQSDPNKVYFVMGRELIDKEHNNRKQFCNDETNIKCIYVDRDDSDDISGMSGSKIRKLAVNYEYEQLYEIYNELLTRDEVDELVNEICVGVKLSTNNKEQRSTRKRSHSRKNDDEPPSKRSRKNGGKQKKQSQKKRKTKKRKCV